MAFIQQLLHRIAIAVNADADATDAATAAAVDTCCSDAINTSADGFITDGVSSVIYSSFPISFNRIVATASTCNF